MNKEIFVKKMQVSGILFKYHVPINEAKIIGTFIEDLEQQAQKQKEVIDKAINDLNIILEIVREQPSGSDHWIINRLEENKKILEEVLE